MKTTNTLMVILLIIITCSCTKHVGQKPIEITINKNVTYENFVSYTKKQLTILGYEEIKMRKTNNVIDFKKILSDSALSKKTLQLLIFKQKENNYITVRSKLIHEGLLPGNFISDKFENTDIITFCSLLKKDDIAVCTQ